MSTVLEVLTIAFRRSGVLPLGRQLASAEITVGVEYLRSCFDQWATAGLFGQLEQCLHEDGGAFEAKEQEWAFHNTADTVTLPTQVMDQGVWRKPRPGAVIVLTNSQTGVTTKYLWDPTKAAWLNLATTFDITDYCPLTGMYDLAIKTMFAVYVADESGMPISPALAKSFAIQKTLFIGRWGVPRRRDVGSYF